MTEKGKKLLEAAKNGGCAIVGMGVSNVPLAEYLLSLGGKITLRDAKEREKLSPKIAELEAAGGELICGTEYLNELNEAVIFRAPGLRPDIAEFKNAEEIKSEYNNYYSKHDIDYRAILAEKTAESARQCSK